MATTSTPPQSKYVEFDEYIDFQLQKTRSGIKANDILTALAGVATLFLAYMLMFVVFDHWIVGGGFSTVGRWLMLGGLLAACTAWVVWRVVIPARKRVTGLYAARAIETTEPGLKHTLLNLVDLRRSGKAVPEDIARAMEKRAAVTLSRTDVDSAVDRRPLMRLSYALLALVVLACLYSLFSPKKISASVWRALFPSSATAVDTAVKIDKVFVEYQGRQHDADVTVAAGSRLDVVVDLSYAAAGPEQVMLYYSTADEKYRDVPVPMKPDAKEPKRYRVRLTGESNRGIVQNTTYRIEAGDAKAGPYQITVVRPPIASVKQVRYVYPKYMERDPKTQDGGHIETWEGTAVTVTAATDQPVTDAWLVFTDTEDITKPAAKARMTVRRGTGLSVELKREIAFREDGSYPRFYHIECVGKNGFKDPRPALYGVTIRRDLPPEIDLIDPQGTERDVPANTQTLPLLYKARDPDFKLRDVTLHAELTRKGNVDGKPEEFEELLFEGSRREVKAAWEWKLDAMRLKAGDTLKFRLRARDNKPPAGNRTFTRWVTLRIVEPVDETKAQRQLQADRDRQKQLQQEQQNNQEDQTAGEQPPGQPPKQDDRKKADPKDGKDGKKKGKRTAGAKQDAGNDGPPMRGKKGAGEPKQDADPPPDGGQDDNNQKQNPEGQRKGTNQGQPKPDEELIKQALRDQQENQRKQRKDGTPQGKDDPENPQPKGKGQGAEKQNPQNGNDPGGAKTTDPQKKSSGDVPNPKTGKTDPGKTDATQKQGKVPMPKQDGGTGGKKDATPPPPKTDGPQKPDGMKSTGGAAQKTEGKKDPMKKEPNGGGTGKSSPKKQPGVEDMGTGDAGANSKKSKSGSEPKKTDRTDGGPRENVKGDGKKATKKNATGDEKGPADPDKSSKSNPTPAKSPEKIERRKGTDPVTKKSTGSGKPKQDGMKNGSENPADAKSKAAKKSKQNPADPKTPPKDNTGKPGAKRPDDRQDPGNQKQQGPGRKDGQKSNRSDGGEAGKSSPKDQGTSGKQKGAGDDAKSEGQRQAAKGQKTGAPGKTAGKGSTTRPKTQDGGKSGDPSKATPAGGQSGKTPGHSGPAPKSLPKGKSNASDGGAGKGVGKRSADPPADDPDPEQKDLNDGRKASNLVLNNLEDKVKRGQVDKDWLKKHGWTSREHALKELARIRKRVNGESGDPQFDEFLKSIRDLKFQSEAGKRTSKGVRKKTIPGEGNTGSENIPPHLRNYYKAFRRSVNR